MLMGGKLVAAETVVWGVDTEIVSSNPDGCAIAVVFGVAGHFSETLEKGIADSDRGGPRFSSKVTSHP